MPANAPEPRFATLTALLSYRAAGAPDRRAYVHLADGENETASFTNAALHDRALLIAHRLARITTPGDRALLLYPPGLEFMAAFFGCLYAGVIAVPSYPPKRNRPDPRLQIISEDADAHLVLTDVTVLAEIEPRLQNTPSLRALTWLATDAESAPETDTPAPSLPDPRPDNLAFLQYTSGSTATPKGVMVSHSNLLHNLDDLDRGWEHDAHSVMITWLPIFHDMGLIYGALMPLYRGFLCVMLPPASFLQRPVRWLEAINRYRGTHSAAPNFAYDLCVASTTPEQRSALDLSSWHMSLNAAEPVRAHTLAAFNNAFAPAGLDPLTVKPGFGLAEATLKVTALPRAERVTIVHLDSDALARHEMREVSPDQAGATAIVGCGWGQVDNSSLIVDPDTFEPCSPDRVGEIWFRGPSAAQGYWQRDEASRETFQARLADGTGPFMRTGDLGFAKGREIFVTGRVKDLIILRGLNHYPQDIELTVERASDAIRASCTAAFSIDTPAGEALAIVAEVERTHLRKFDHDAVVSSLRSAVASHHELPVHRLVFLKPASIPKTSSGKIQRALCRRLLQEGELKIIAEWVQTTATPPAPNTASGDQLETFIREALATLLKVDAAHLDPTAPFAEQGVDSLAAVELSGLLEQHLGRRLPPTLAYDFPHLRALAKHLSETGSHPSTTPPAAPNETVHREPIAVVGMSCRFPGAPDIDAFWSLLTEGRDAITPVPADRWNAADHTAPAFGGFLAQVDQFDAEFFGLSAREANLLDPQQRLLLETSWEALEHAGIDPTSLAGTPTGVFMGISTHDYRLLLARSDQGTAAHTGTGNALSIAANRLSYWLDLRGPSLALDTACSSSLVALHHAVRSLRSGETSVALVGGVNLLLAPDVSESFAAAGMLAPDGHCKTFDADADGYVRGEGAGVAILKPLSAAQRDGDHIFALIHGSALNQDGRSNGLTAPNGPAQQAVIRAALRDAHVAPHQISFLETHGTGTALGDPIEVNAARAVLAVDRDPTAPCTLGAVKTQIGHLEAAAGMAGLIKTVLALEHRTLPGNLHLNSPSRHLDQAAPVLRLATTTTAWDAGKRFAGVSSFGFGGTNAHVILGEAPQQRTPRETPKHRAPAPYPLSARSPAALAALVQAHATHLRALPETTWPDAAITAATGRARWTHRVAVVATSPVEAAELLAAASASFRTDEPPRVAFLFSGQGSLFPGAGIDLIDTCPAFAAAFSRCQKHILEIAGWDVKEALGSEEKLAQTEFAQVALFTVEYSLACVWQAWGIKPVAVAGHSVGEYAAAVIAGAMELGPALSLLVTRARLMGALGETGAMAAIMASAENVAPLATQHGTEIGAYNSARQTVITGSAAAVKSTMVAAEAAGHRVALLSVRQGYHSVEMDPMLPDFTAAAKSAALGEPERVFISSSTGQRATGELATSEYWIQQIRRPVRWAAAAAALAAESCDVVIEVGPRNLLAALSAQSWPDQPVTWLTSLQRDTTGRTTLLQAASQAWSCGAPVDWHQVHAGIAHRRIALPTYPFQRERYWFADTSNTVPPLPDQGLIDRLTADDALTPSEIAAIPAVLAALHRTHRAHRAQTDEAAAITHEVKWHPAPLVANFTAADQGWLIVGHAPTLGKALPQATSAESFVPGPWNTVVHVAGSAAANVECHRLLTTIRGLLSSATSARLRIVTRAAAPVGPDDGIVLQLHHAAVWGMGLAFGLEQPERWGGLIDLPPQASADEIPALVAELQSDSGEDQVAWRSHRLVPRLNPVKLPQASPPPLSPHASYWVTGGLGGIGLQATRWLIDAGARHIILSSRSDPSDATRETLAAMADASGATIKIAAMDVTAEDAVNALLDEAAHTAHPVRGILHAAGVLRNQPIEDVTPTDIDQVLAPKVTGAQVLHQATRKRSLDFLVFFSSIASVWGSRWQLAYSAANGHLDALATHRRALDLPAVSINWGPWSGGGMAGAAEQKLLKRMGITALSAAINFSALNDTLAADRARVIVARVDWPVFRSLVELHRPKPLFENLEDPNTNDVTIDPATPNPWVQKWTLLQPDARDSAVRAWLQVELAAVLGLKSGRLPDVRTGFFDLGFDSLLAVEMRHRLSRALQRPFRATLAFDHSNIVALAAHIVSVLWPQVAAESSAPQTMTRIAPSPEIDPSATDEDLDAALNARLARLESLTRDD
ncbi:type I polyketide synthase [Synoicihabitans lomoniglobus]|uniref:Type I polyketide synthase n=1 Tax=Synoicihabitans lomoniglobus TaxID=2909285 RepID=A0AAE9ZWS5_9BACT|nr:type I polyketide synthase [Opitutaceae bacterium LMO-M01]WED65716.1 type I polyketide synthase [Opitutaceae bacterium LMO-M01]